MDERKAKGQTPDERDCIATLQGLGFAPTKRGWPDFFCVDPQTGKVLVVEVKASRYEALKMQQIEVMEALQDAGIQCIRYDPDDGSTVFDRHKERALRARRPSRTHRPSNARQWPSNRK